MKSFFYKTLLPLFFVGLTIFIYSLLGNSSNKLEIDSKNILDTFITIRTLPGQNGFNNQAFKIMEKVEHMGEWHKSDSEINLAGKAAANVPEELSGLIRESLKYAELTDGAFDPTVRKLVELWSIGDKNYYPTKKEIEAAKELVGHKKLSKQLEGELTRLDLGGVLKGYAIDSAAKFLKQNNINDFLISTVSSTITSGVKHSGMPWLVGVENPRKQSADKPMIAVLKLFGNYSVSTSGDYQRYFMKGKKRFSHILDPETGYPANKCISVTVVTERSAAFADALSTAIFVMGYPEGLKFANKLSKTDALIVDTQGKVHLTEGMRAVLKNSEKSIY